METVLTLAPNRTANPGPDDVGQHYFDLDARQWWRVVKYIHCAGGMDEHKITCPLNHWYSYEWDKLEVPDARL